MINAKHANAAHERSSAAERACENACTGSRGRPLAPALRANPLRLWRLRQVMRTEKGARVKMTIRVAALAAQIPHQSWQQYEAFVRLPSTAPMAKITEFTSGEVTGAAMVAAHNKFHGRAVQGS